jgi:hypothetical protein
MDTKTLTLASIELTADRLSQFLTYQQVLLEELNHSRVKDGWSGRFAFAHQHGLARSGLDTVTYEKVRALVGDFYARAATLQIVQERVAAARAKVTASEAARAALDPDDQRLLARAAKELPELEDWTEFSERYGARALTLLQEKAGEVMRLHREVAVAEGCPKGLATH